MSVFNDVLTRVAGLRISGAMHRIVAPVPVRQISDRNPVVGCDDRVGIILEGDHVTRGQRQGDGSARTSMRARESDPQGSKVFNKVIESLHGELARWRGKSVPQSSEIGTLGLSGGSFEPQPPITEGVL